MTFPLTFLPSFASNHTTIVLPHGFGAATINYGLFINTAVDFAIMAFVVFIMVKQINRLRREAPTTRPPDTRECTY
jgi:large conductance mechanosensitive channel